VQQKQTSYNYYLLPGPRPVQYWQIIESDLIIRFCQERGDRKQPDFRNPPKELGLSGKIISENDYAPKLAKLIRNEMRSVEKALASPPIIDNENEPDVPDFCLEDGDSREMVFRTIRARRGQDKFRRELFKYYGRQCMVTGCTVEAILEAAHIKPYRGKENDNEPQNGLLLRPDIHTLFDLDLLGIEPVELKVELHPELEQDNEYAKLKGKHIQCKLDHEPFREALQLRYNQFKKPKIQTVC
jgi:hypothetical protein